MSTKTGLNQVSRSFSLVMHFNHMSLQHTFGNYQSVLQLVRTWSMWKRLLFAGGFVWMLLQCWATMSWLVHSHFLCHWDIFSILSQYEREKRKKIVVKLKLWLYIILFWLEKKAWNTWVFPLLPVVFETHEKWQQAQLSLSEVSGCLIFTYFL